MHGPHAHGCSAQLRDTHRSALPQAWLWRHGRANSERRSGPRKEPILEGDRFTGRIDLKTQREEGHLEVKGAWWEPSTDATTARKEALRRYLERLALCRGTRGTIARGGLEEVGEHSERRAWPKQFLVNCMPVGSEAHMNMPLFRAREGASLEGTAKLDLTPFIARPN